jgi:hypothetical protein
MRVTGGTGFSFLQSQPSLAVAGIAPSGAFAMGAYPVGFFHISIPFPEDRRSYFWQYGQ